MSLKLENYWHANSIYGVTASQASKLKQIIAHIMKAYVGNTGSMIHVKLSTFSPRFHRKGNFFHYYSPYTELTESVNAWTHLHSLLKLSLGSCNEIPSSIKKKTKSCKQRHTCQ